MVLLGLAIGMEKAAISVQALRSPRLPSRFALKFRDLRSVVVAASATSEADEVAAAASATSLKELSDPPPLACAANGTRSPTSQASTAALETVGHTGYDMESIDSIIESSWRAALERAYSVD